MTLPTIGSLQLNSNYNIEDNLATIEKAIEHAKQSGVNMLVIPENACRMGGQLPLSDRFDELSNWYAKLALQHKLFIIAGTLPCPYRPDGTPVPNKRVRQVSQLFAPDGSRLARYDKIHLFRAQVADKTGSYDEAQTFEPGDTLVVAQCDIGALLPSIANNKHPLSIGMMICFDLRFPALAQHLRQTGADILTAPSAFTYQTGKAHWELLLRARALDSQCMVVGSAQGGIHQVKETSRHTWGHSSIANANGDIVATTNTTSLTQTDLLANGASPDNEVTEEYALITSAFDAEAQNLWRRNMPIHHCHKLG